MLIMVGSILKYQNSEDYFKTHIAQSFPKCCIMSHILLHEPLLNYSHFYVLSHLKIFEKKMPPCQTPRRARQVLERLHSVSTTRGKRIHLFQQKIERGENYLASGSVNCHGLTIS